MTHEKINSVFVSMSRRILLAVKAEQMLYWIWKVIFLF